MEVFTICVSKGANGIAKIFKNMLGTFKGPGLLLSLSCPISRYTCMVVSHKVRDLSTLGCSNVDNLSNVFYFLALYF